MGQLGKLRVAFYRFMDPLLLLLCFAGALRNGAGIVWAYNIAIFFDTYHPDVQVLWYRQGRPQDLGGGGPRIFFSDLGICMSRSDMLRMAKPCALLGGFGGMLPREIFLKRCNLVRFWVYFDQILSLFFSKNAIFYIKNKYFRYTFVMGYFS